MVAGFVLGKPENPRAVNLNPINHTNPKPYNPKPLNPKPWGYN